MQRFLVLAGILMTAVLAAGAARSGAADPGFRLHEVGRFDSPVYVTAPPGDRHRVFVVEQAGRIRIVQDGRTLPTPFLDIRGRTHDAGEFGLLSMAFAPDYATSHRFYVFYTDADINERVVEFRATSATTADPASARDVMVMADPDGNNNGGQLQFGPDGYLYIANGDGGGPEEGERDPHHTAQDLGSPFGKILRIDPRGAGDGDHGIPPDNPFQGAGQLPETYLLGVRNPWRFSFDRATGAMVIADVGRSEQEEVDYFRRGEGLGTNLGWPAYEGRAPGRPDTSVGGSVRPVLVASHTTNRFCAITGGYVSRDPKVPATLGRYLFGDFCRGDIFTARLRQPDTRARNAHVHVPSLVSFGEDGRGRVYAVSIEGAVYRIVKR